MSQTKTSEFTPIRDRGDYVELWFDDETGVPLLASDSAMQEIAEAIGRILGMPEEFGLEIKWRKKDKFYLAGFSYKIPKISIEDWHPGSKYPWEIINAIVQEYDGYIISRWSSSKDDTWELSSKNYIDDLQRGHTIFNRLLDYYDETYCSGKERDTDYGVGLVKGLERELADLIIRTERNIAYIGDRIILGSNWEECLITNAKPVIEIMLRFPQTFFNVLGIEQFKFNLLMVRDLYAPDESQCPDGFHEYSYAWQSEFTSKQGKGILIKSHELQLYPLSMVAKDQTNSYGFVVECRHWQGKGKKFRAYLGGEVIGTVDCNIEDDESEKLGEAITLVLRREIPFPDALIAFMAKVMVNKTIGLYQRRPFSFSNPGERGQKHRLKKRRDDLLNIVCWLPDINAVYDEAFKEDWLPDINAVYDDASKEDMLFASRFSTIIKERVWKNVLEAMNTNREGEMNE